MNLTKKSNLQTCQNKRQFSIDFEGVIGVISATHLASGRVDQDGLGGRVQSRKSIPNVTKEERREKCKFQQHFLRGLSVLILRNYVIATAENDI